jgi:hypothetical protein
MRADQAPRRGVSKKPAKRVKLTIVPATHPAAPKRDYGFGPMPGSGGALHQQVKQQHAQSRRASEKAPRNDLPRFPVIKGGYTPKQRQYIQKRIITTVKKGQKKDPNYQADLFAERRTGDRATRQFVNKYQGLADTNQGIQRTKAGVNIAARIYGKQLKGQAARELAMSTENQAVARDLPGKKPKSKIKFGGQTKVAGVGIPGLHQVGAGFRLVGRGVSPVLRELSDPAYFVYGAEDAARNGKPILKTALKNAHSHKVSSSDLLRQSGSGKTMAAVAGLGADIVLDPLNYVTLGGAPVAEALARNAGHLKNIATDLERVGDTAKAAKYTARAEKLLAKAKDAPENRGIQVGLRFGKNHRITTSGATTARVMKVTKASGGAKRVMESPPVQVIGKNLSAAFKPAGISRKGWEDFRHSERLTRGQTEAGVHVSERLGRGIDSTVRGLDQAQGRAAKRLARVRMANPSRKGLDEHSEQRIIAALDAAPKSTAGPLKAGALPQFKDAYHSFDDLSPEERQIAEHLQELYGKAGAEEHAAGLLGTIRPNYYPKILSKDAKKAASKSRTRGGNPYNLQRTGLTASEENAAARAAGLPPKFDENLGRVTATRLGKSKTLLAQRAHEGRVAKLLGRPYKKGTEIDPHEAVYVTGPHGLRLAGTKGSEIAKAYNGVKFEHGEKLIVLPKDIGERTLRGAIPSRTFDPNTKDLRDLGLRYDKFSGYTKSALTVLNAPAYQLRNFAGDLFNARGAETDFRSVAQGAKLMRLRAKGHALETHGIAGVFDPATTVPIGHGRHINAKQLIKEMEDHNVIGSGQFGHDFGEHTHTASQGFTSMNRKTLLGTVTGKTTTRKSPVRYLREKTAHLENTVRAGTYIAARKRGFSPAEAAEHAAKAHFDYADLTNFERVIKRVFPFWTFTARNTPLQARNIVKRPGLYANYSLAMDEGRKQAGLSEDYQDRLPDYQARQLSIPANIKGHRVLLSPQLPITDLNRTQQALSGNAGELFKGTAQMLHPIIKNPAEYGLNNSFFFRQPIYQDSDHPDAPHWTPRPKWLDLLPKEAKVVLAGGNKDAASKGLMTAKANYWLRTLPQTNTLTQGASGGADLRNQDALQTIASQLTGVKVNAYEPKKYNVNALYSKVDKVTAQLADAKKLGHKAEAKRLASKKYAILDDIAKARKAAGMTYYHRKKAKPKAVGSGTGGAGLGAGLGGGNGLGG